MRHLLVNLDSASIWSQASAIVFGCMFVVLAVWVFMPSRKSQYQRAEKLPLQE